MPKPNKKIREPKVASGEGYCRKCQKTMSLTNNFYEATNPRLDSNGYMSICRKCCNDLYDDYFKIYGNMTDALKATCQDLDVRFSKQALDHTQTHVDNIELKGKTVSLIFGVYKSKLSSTGKNNEGFDTFRFKDSANNQEVQIQINNNAVDDDKERIKFWGNFSKEDLDFLQNFFDDFTSQYECDSPTQVLLFKNAAKTQLNADKALMNNDITLYNNLMKTLSSILGDSNIKPNQESGANATDQLAYGNLIKKWENDRPIPKPDPEWEDVDGIKKGFRVWFLGHLCKMMGINNEYSKEYEEEMNTFRVNLSNETSNLDDLDEGD